MAEIFGKVVKASTKNGTSVMTFEIPALSGEVAKRRAKRNAQFKGLSNTSVGEIKSKKSSDVPGQNIYTIEVEGEV